MGIPVHTCPGDLPARLPGILSAAGYQVTEAHPSKPRLPGIVVKGLFGFQVSDGTQVLRVSGCEEKDGTLCFMIVPVWSWDPRRIFGWRRFYGALEGVLLRSGAQFVTEHEIEA